MGDNSTTTTPATKKEDGYDLPIYGLENGSFYYIHVPAIVCIALSFSCVVTVLILSFRRQNFRLFFTTWSKSDRFIVYLAICDGGYNIFHSIDHMHIVIAKNHVYPRALCELYGFTLAEFIMGQNLMVNIVAINAFMLVYFKKKLNYGRCDWRLLAWTFGAPFVGATIAGITGQLGPNGTFCYFDGVKGVVTNICFTTVPLLIIIVMNVVMYLLTWRKVKDETRNIRMLTKKSNRNQPKSHTNASHRAAKTMTFFVVAFLIQWWSLALFGVWAIADDEVPQVIFHFVTTFTNLGGCLNLGIYLLIRRKAALQSASDKECKRNIEMKSSGKSTDSGQGTGATETSKFNEP